LWNEAFKEVVIRDRQLAAKGTRITSEFDTVFNSNQSVIVLPVQAWSRTFMEQIFEIYKDNIKIL
jgi:hypothetical protein